MGVTDFIKKHEETIAAKIIPAGGAIYFMNVMSAGMGTIAAEATGSPLAAIIPIGASAIASGAIAKITYSSIKEEEKAKKKAKKVV